MLCLAQAGQWLVGVSVMLCSVLCVSVVVRVSVMLCWAQAGQ